MSLKILKNNLYNFSNYLNEIFLSLSCRINSPYLCSVSWNISLFLLNYKKNINTKNKILVLYKSFGSDDVEFIKKNEKNEFNFFYFPRNNLKIIFNCFFKKVKNDLTDDKYFSNNDQIELAKKDYQNFLIRILKIFNKRNNFLGILSFNFRYKAEKELQIACKLTDIKFIVCQKESLHYNDKSAITDLYIRVNSKNGPYNGDYITVYTEKFKEVLIKASICSAKKIYVVGMPRADFFFKNIDAQKKHILLLMPFWKPPQILETKISFNQEMYSKNITDVILDFAQKNPQENIVIKTKMFDRTDNSLDQIIQKKKIKNIILKKGGSSKNLIKDAKVVVGFQSTGLIEALILRKPIIVPFFDLNLNQTFKECTLKLDEISYYAHDRISMMRYLEDICEKKIDFPKVASIKVNNIINHYIGNNDGNSSDKLLNVFNKILK